MIGHSGTLLPVHCAAIASKTAIFRRISCECRCASVSNATAGAIPSSAGYSPYPSIRAIRCVDADDLARNGARTPHRYVRSGHEHRPLHSLGKPRGPLKAVFFIRHRASAALLMRCPSIRFGAHSQRPSTTTPDAKVRIREAAHFDRAPIALGVALALGPTSPETVELRVFAGHRMSREGPPSSRSTASIARKGSASAVNMASPAALSSTPEGFRKNSRRPAASSSWRMR
jgi:hypothetical protein